MKKYRHIRCKSYFILKIFFCISCGVANAHEEISIIDISQAINIAKNQMLKEKEKGMVVSDTEIISAKKYTRVSNDLLQRSTKPEYYNRLRNKLDNKIYWFVYFISPQFNKGGDVGIFIDAKTSAIIFIYRGK